MGATNHEQKHINESEPQNPLKPESQPTETPPSTAPVAAGARDLAMATTGVVALLAVNLGWSGQ